MPDEAVAYSFTELEQVWIDAGGDPAQAQTAAAVASAESHGCRYALAGPADVRPVKACVYRATHGENSFGLWQINIGPGANPQYAGVDLFDPINNARAAVAISRNGSDWSPWSTYESGAYRAYLPGIDIATPGPNLVGPNLFDGTTVRPRSGDVYTVNPVHIGDAWGLLTAAVAQDLPAAYKRVRQAGLRIRAAGR